MASLANVRQDFQGGALASPTFHRVSFGYHAGPDDLFGDPQFGVSEGWTGVIGANGSGKTTILLLACGELELRIGSVHRPAHVLYYAQRTDDPPSVLEDLLEAGDAEAYRICGQLGVESDWHERWVTLSCRERLGGTMSWVSRLGSDSQRILDSALPIPGEVRKLLLATKLALRPHLIVMDEPAHHTDLASLGSSDAKYNLTVRLGRHAGKR